MVSHTQTTVAAVATADDERLQLARSLFDRRNGCENDEELSQLNDEIADLHMPLVHQLAHRYSGRGETYEELFQVACVGLMKAINGFRTDRDCDFLSYAIPTITGELKRYFRDSCWAIRPTRRIQELHVEVSAAAAELQQELGCDPRPAQLADHLGVSTKTVEAAIAASSCYTPPSLDVVRDDSDQQSLGAHLGIDDAEFTRREAHLVLVEAMTALSATERRVVGLRFFSGLTQREIADEIGATQMQVSRLLTRTMTTLRHRLGVDLAVLVH